MEEVKSNPLGKTPPRMPAMSDTKNNLLAKDGWVKRTQNVNGVEIHYVGENIHTSDRRPSAGAKSTGGRRAGAAYLASTRRERHRQDLPMARAARRAKA